MPSLRTGRSRSTGMESTPRHQGSRTAEVLYLLSRGKQLEHPHMINVHYAAHQPGPTLRDVKARLVALRGKGMPDSFSWSYKRSYKDTFIWCDLFDDDLILPLPGSSEYVMKAVKLFDAVTQDGELEEEELPVRNCSPSKPISRVESSRPEHLHVEKDVSMAIKKSLLLINNPQAVGVMTSESSMDLNKQIMSNLAHSKRAPDVCSVEHSEISSSGTVPDDAPDQRQPSTASPKRANQEKQCHRASQTAHRELRHTTTDCNLEQLQTSKKDETTSMSPGSPSKTPGGCVRRRTWEKEVDKSTIFTQFVKNGSDVDEPLEEHPGSCAPNPEDPFLYGVLRKATRLGSSFRPRLCRGVDVVNSTRTKLRYRTKAKEEGNQTTTTSFIDEPQNSTDSPEKPMKEFKTLSEYFDTMERTNSNSSPAVDKLVNEPHSVEGQTPRPSQLGLAQEDSSAAADVALDRPRRPFGNEALDASYRKTMEVLAKLPSSRGSCRVHTVPQREGHKSSTRSESKGNKQEVKASAKVSSGSNSRQGAPPQPDDFLHHSCSIHRVDDPVRTPEESVMAPKQRRAVVKKASFEASTVSCRAKATVKGPDEKTSVKAPRNVSKESASKLEDSTKPQIPESFAFDSRALHSGNKQGLKMATQVAAPKVEAKAAAAEAAPRLNSSEGPKRWPFEPPARPRDFKSREDRPLTPGLTSMDWEKSLQEACMHSEPPTNLVLQECSQCGRTFKPESLQVHMRGCRGVNKPKPPSATQRRASL